jgi:organic radical activating enzyme
MEYPEPIYYISECFQSIQGEGNYSGVNSLFIRFHYCNLTCTWCDTKYSWTGKPADNKVYTTSDLKEIIRASSCHHVIFTGGEPTLYRLDKLIVPGKKFHVETNGTVIPTEPLEISFKNTTLKRDAMEYAVIKKFNWVVSPKLTNSKQKINEQSLRFWAATDFCIFKFVVRTNSDLEEVEKVRQIFNMEQNRIYIAIEGQTLESQLQPLLVEEIIRRGFNFSPRLHVMLWGATRMK